MSLPEPCPFTLNGEPRWGWFVGPFGPDNVTRDGTEQPRTDESELPVWLFQRFVPFPKPPWVTFATRDAARAALRDALAALIADLKGPHPV